MQKKVVDLDKLLDTKLCFISKAPSLTYVCQMHHGVKHRPEEYDASCKLM